MSSDPPKSRKYSEEEFALILRKASEMQDSRASSPGDSGGGRFSLEEIQSIAAEAGIDPDAVARAAAVLGALEPVKRRGVLRLLFGEPGTVHLDLEVPGRVPPEEMGRILADIRRVLEHQGQASEVLGGVQWKTVGLLSAIHVNISPRGERTSVQVVGDRSSAGAATFIFPMAGAGILVGALGAAFDPGSALGITALVTGLMGGGFLVFRTLWARGSKRFRRRLTQLMEALGQSVGAAAVPSGSGAKGENPHWLEPGPKGRGG